MISEIVRLRDKLNKKYDCECFGGILNYIEYDIEVCSTNTQKTLARKLHDKLIRSDKFFDMEGTFLYTQGLEFIDSFIDYHNLKTKELPHYLPDGFWSRGFHSFYNLDNNVSINRDKSYSNGCYIKNGKVGYYRRGDFLPIYRRHSSFLQGMVTVEKETIKLEDIDWEQVILEHDSRPCVVSCCMLCYIKASKEKHE